MARDAVAEVRDRTEVVDLVSNYVQLKKTGRSYKGLCPFHQEKTPSFVVFPESGNFHCFGCGRGGDVFTFYMGVEHVEFRDALQELAKRDGITRRYIRRLVDLAFLSPQLVDVILQGRQPVVLTATRLTELDLSLDWVEQHRLLVS